MATDRLMATPWRFENNKGGGNTLKKAQDERIETEKNLLQKNNDQLKIDASAFKITWAERFDEVNDRCRAKILSHTDKEELKLVRKANMMVRRDALKRLYSNEYQVWERELNQRGLCMHRELI